MWQCLGLGGAQLQGAAAGAGEWKRWAPGRRKAVGRWLLLEAAEFLQAAQPASQPWGLLSRLTPPQSHLGGPCPFSPTDPGPQGDASHQQGLDEAAVELADVAVQVPRLRETALTPAAGMWLLPGVDHGVPAQVVGVLEALATLHTRVGLLSRVCPLMSLQCVCA